MVFDIRFAFSTKPTWAGCLIVVAAVQGGDTGLVAVAGAVGAVRPPSFADA